MNLQKGLWKKKKQEKSDLAKLLKGTITSTVLLDFRHNTA